MSSKREQVLAAIRTLVEGALPGATVKRSQDNKPEQIGPGGTVIIRDGDLTESEVLLSPLTYIYDHHIPLEIAAFEANGVKPTDALDMMMVSIGNAIMADRTLGGLCDWIDAVPPVTDNMDAEGVAPGRWADAAIMATYATSNALV